MIVVETKAKNYSLQFQSQSQADALINALSKVNETSVSDLAAKLKHRLGTQYAHDDIVCTTVVYNTEIPVLLTAYFDGLTTQGEISQVTGADSSAVNAPKTDDDKPKSSFLQKIFKK